MPVPEFEYQREYLSDLQQVYELAADEAKGIADYLVAIEDTSDVKLKKLLREILAQERTHLARLIAYADECLEANPREV